MIEIVDRPRHDHEISRRIDIIEGVPRYGARIVDVDVVIHHDYAAREHQHVAEPPERVHHFFCLARVRFFDRDDAQIVKAAFDR